MTPKSLWTILVKIFGLYLIWQSGTLLTQFISTFAFIGQRDQDQYPLAIFGTVFLFLVVGCVYFIVLRYCLFKTDLVIEKLHLEKGFSEEEFELNIHRSTILTIATIVIGGIMFTENIPQLCYRIFSYAQHAESYTKFTDNPYSAWFVFDILKVVIGYFLMTESRMVVNFIERKKRKASLKTQEESEPEL
ncbi:hypothetical protein ACFGVR_00115 [Mucilaginibacter sp. AW1-3]